MREHFKGNVKELAINTCKIFIFMYLSPLLRLREAFLLVVVFEWTGKSFLSLFSISAPTLKSQEPLITWFCKIMGQTKHISTARVPMSTKLGRLVTYIKRLPPRKSYDTLVTCSCEIT